MAVSDAPLEDGLRCLGPEAYRGHRIRCLNRRATLVTVQVSIMQVTGGRPLLGVERAEPVGADVADHAPHPVLVDKGHVRDLGHVYALSRRQTICSRRVKVT
jgi:hypothetical protein